MKSLNLSASALPRAFRCLASVTHVGHDFKTENAAKGTARHAVKESAINARDFAALPATIGEILATYESVHAEVAVAYDTATDTARIIGVGIDRAYGDLGPFEIPGTLDILASDPATKRVFVGDWKGWEDVEAPDKNKQLAHNALCALRLSDCTEVLVGIMNEDREPVIAALDVFELEMFALALREMQREAVNAAKRPTEYEVEGAHCKYCPAWNACHTKRAFVAKLQSGEIEKAMRGFLSMDDDANAAAGYELSNTLFTMKKRLDAAIFARAATRPIPLGDGRVFGKIIEPGNEKLDADITYAVLREELGQEAADVGMKREASKAGIERAVKAAGKAPVAKKQEEILVEIRKRKGVSKPPAEKWAVFTPSARPQLKAVGE